MASRRWSRQALAAWALLLLTACSPGNPLNRKAVSGSVMLNGRPLPAGTIDFQPLGGAGIGSGASISNGTYAIPEEGGLPPGRYRIMIFGIREESGELPADHMPGDELAAPPQDLVPTDWNVDSDHQIEVREGGPFEFNFELSS